MNENSNVADNDDDDDNTKKKDSGNEVKISTRIEWRLTTSTATAHNDAAPQQHPPDSSTRPQIINLSPNLIFVSLHGIFLCLFFFFWFLLLSLLSVCSLACCCSFTHVYSIYKSRELTSADLRKQYWWWELQPGGRLAAADESLPRPDGCFSEPFYSPREYWLPHWQLIGSVEFTTVARKTLVAWTGMRLEMLNIVQQWPPYVVVWCCVCCVCCVQKQIANREQKER